ncbi:mitogen-activated protein kinase-binding protein 1 isoform X5 [Salmo salar]|uniref:Mitogen-activated protein kinase-binding protein 1 isoform X5 n=1 Tax=Salmo salar TaxID=8030 RepID=A0A1S3SQW0_SALSA|nr:mitogen-activated protein kinase-binding protein 1 isoform X5 [Salmo salar]|eukprot:XP_014066722.1 PREDICTED: mitogen-activated protein kinase-binding protein 1-like isoform X1 [Salmo salar]
MTVEGSTIKSRIKNLLRSPSIKLRRNKALNNKENLTNKVTLEKVLGITAFGNRALACDPRSGLVAYPAGCVVVLLNPKKNKQHHILNSSRKTITTLSFSPDGKFVVTGESGHMPAVRVWDVAERTQVAELQEHKYGISCVAFSPNSKYIVSVGYQHDMIINVWAWKKNIVVAANKVSSKVTAVSFSDDSNYFVTAGNRHVKFWYLDHTKSSKVNATVPLLGRSGLLGELRNNFFSDVACGKGRKAGSTFCITSSGLLCEFNDKRLLDKWVELRKNDSVTTSQATSLSVTDELIFCGCADGTVRAFSPVNLHFICTLPRPHCLGTDIATVVEASHLFSHKMDARCPDTVAVSYDPASRWLSCVYNDHSLYVWDVRDLRKVGKVYSALYHSACVWSVEVYPDRVSDGRQPCLPPGSFLSCSSDNTVRLWNTDGHNTTLSRNVISNDLQKIIYMDNNTAGLLDTECLNSGNGEKADPQTSETRTGIRTVCVSPDGQHLASGDRTGTLRIHDLESMGEILNVQAHDSEILCLEYSKPETGLKLLATASRDRLIHVLDAEREYSLLQTLDEHSSSITAVRFAADEGKVRMISCGADKSIYFRTAQKSDEGTVFTRTHHIVRKTTLYDMDIDPTRKYAVIGCQDRSIRIFNISNGKQKKLYKGSQGEDGTVIKVQTDPSGLYVATSCSDKNISIFDFYSGECVATMFGHSEVVTGMKFTNDCKHMITVSGDSCIFVWRLAPELTISMRQRLSDLKQNGKPVQKTPPHKPCNLSTRREVHSTPPIVTMSSDSDKEVEEEGIEEEDEEERVSPYMVSGCSAGEDTDTSDEKHNSHELKRENSFGRRSSQGSHHSEDRGPRPRRRWSRRMDSMDLMVKSMLDLRQLDSFAMPPSSPTKTQTQPVSDSFRDPFREDELGSTISLQPLTAWGESEQRSQQRPKYIMLSPQTPNTETGPVLYPDGFEDRVSLAGSEYLVKELLPGPGASRTVKGYQNHNQWSQGHHDKHSSDSAFSVDYSSSRLSSPDSQQQPPGEDSEPMEPLSMDGNSSELDMEELEVEEEGGVGRGDAKGMTVVPQTPDQEAFLKQHFGNLAELNNPVSPTRVATPDSISISSKFLSQCATGSRTSFPFLSKSIGEGKVGSGVVKPLVSQVRPLMEHNQGQSHNQDRDQTQSQGYSQSQDYGHSQRKLSEDSQKGPTGRLEVVDTTEKCFNLRASPLRKKLFNPAVDSRRMVSPVAKAAASHLTTTGMRKSQSVQNLHTEVDMPLTLSRPSKEVAPLTQHSQFHHSQASEGPVTLPTTPRSTLPSMPPFCSPTSPQPQDNTSTSHSTATMPRSLKSRCSYMSPTTSSMAKMSRSVSMGDNLNVTEEESGSGSSSNTSNSNPPMTKSQSCSTQSPSTKTSIPVAMVSSASSSLSGMGLAMPQAAVFPTLIASSNSNPTTKSLQAKLTCSTRPQLNLDISKSLPDKPSLAVFTPNGTSKTTTTSSKTVKEDNLSPRSPVSLLPQQGQNQPPPLSNNVQLVIALSPSPAAPVETSLVQSPEAEQLGLTAELRPEAPVVDNRLEQPKAEECQGLTQEESPVTELSLQGNPVYLLSQRGPGQDRTDNSLSMESCRVLASELQNSFRKASWFYRMVNSVPVASRQEQHEMARVLSEAFEVVRAELSSLPQSSPSPSGEPAAGGSLCMLACRPVGPGTGGSGSGEERTLALLEQYSELLLKAVEKRLDNNQVS